MYFEIPYNNNIIIINIDVKRLKGLKFHVADESPALAFVSLLFLSQLL